MKTHGDRILGFLCAPIVTVLLAGCPAGDAAGGKAASPLPAQAASSPPPASAAPSTPAGGYRVVEVAKGAILRGAVRYAGTPPPRPPLAVDHDRETCAGHDLLSEELIVSPDGKVRNAVVWLEGVREGKAWPEGESLLDQEGCVYRPHVTAVGAGRPVKFVNSDPVIHNVNTFPRENPPLNVSLLAKGMGRPVTRTLKLPDEVKVTCDAHKWMSAWIIVRDSPYFAVTGDDGSYALEQVPPGRYTLVAWHEALGRVERSVEVGAGATRTEDFDLKPR
ncbi:MAG: hypothetical protein HY720_02545 [Planctomycetes bacterium]|nr:hypothetical protein [Planctomycetota bacterium]